jgi:hypothetical protein
VQKKSKKKKKGGNFSFIILYIYKKDTVNTVSADLPTVSFAICRDLTQHSSFITLSLVVLLVQRFEVCVDENFILDFTHFFQEFDIEKYSKILEKAEEERTIYEERYKYLNQSSLSAPRINQNKTEQKSLRDMFLYIENLCLYPISLSMSFTFTGIEKPKNVPNPTQKVTSGTPVLTVLPVFYLSSAFRQLFAPLSLTITPIVPKETSPILAFLSRSSSSSSFSTFMSSLVTLDQCILKIIYECKIYTFFFFVQLHLTFHLWKCDPFFPL